MPSERRPAPGEAPTPRVRRRSEARPDEAAPLEDLQSLLASSVQRLARATGAERVYAWLAQPSGDYAVNAACFERGHPLRPDARDAAAIRYLEGRRHAADLGDEPMLRDLAERHDVGAAATLRTSDGRPIAILLLGGPSDPAGRVRPRTLARLDSATLQLQGPATAALMASRLSALDAEVRQLSALANLGDLVTEIVHEIRNPLVSVKTFLELLPDRLDDPTFHTEFRDIVAEELRRMERLIDTLMRQARAEVQPAGEGASAREVITSVVQLLGQRASEREIELEVQDDGSEARVDIHEDALRQVILNLVLNALEVTPAGGQVRIRTTVRDVEDAGHVRLTVKDSGPGVAPELRSRIFEPFVSTRGDGAGGLGLAITRRIVEEAGGAIELESPRTGGASFHVSLPCNAALPGPDDAEELG